MPTDPLPVPVVKCRPFFRRAVATGVRRLVSHWALALACAALPFASGCSLFEHPVERVAPSPLGWLTSWNTQPLANTKPFDLETIRPIARQSELSADTTLEITIWDLYEPGRPHTFPVRVSARLTVEIPMLGEQPVAGKGLPELETALSEEFRRRDLLKTPRILVRNLESGHIRVQVTGAVVRPGSVELSRDQASVYDALVAAGGLKNLAGTQISVTHHPVSAAMTARVGNRGSLIRGQSPDEEASADKNRGPQIRPARRGDAPPVEPQAEPAAEPEEPAEEQRIEEPAPEVEQPEPEGPTTPRANRIEEVSVPLPPQALSRAAQKTASTPPTSATGPATPSIIDSLRPSAGTAPTAKPAAGNPSDQRTTWFDITREADRQTLQGLVLVEGDSILIKGAAPPIRIAGSVARPGDYTLPAGRVLDLWQALDLAGGVKSSGTPLVITLLRPPSEGRGPQRWQQQFESLDKRATNLPKIQPGDVIDITPPTSSRLKKAVGGLWNR